MTRAVRPKETLLRFVIDAEGMVQPDLGARAPGRGFWLEPRRAVLAEALKRNAFSRAAKRPARVPPDLGERLEAGLERRIEDLLGFARRAGAAQHGIDRVRLWLSEGRAAVYLLARDAGDTGRGAMAEASRGVPVVVALDAETMGRPFGQSRVAHAAVAKGGIAQALLVEAGRLAGLRGQDEEAPVAGRRDRRGPARQASVPDGAEGQGAAPQGSARRVPVQQGSAGQEAGTLRDGQDGRGRRLGRNKTGHGAAHSARGRGGEGSDRNG